MKTAVVLFLLSLFGLSVAQDPQPVLLFNGFDSDLVSCQSQPITWIYAGPNAPLTLTITNVGVDQNQPNTSIPPNTLTNGVFDKRYQQLQRREPITVTIATDVLPADESYVWPTVLIPQGYYQIVATIGDPAYTTSSAAFHVSQGPDVSCLGAIPTASTTGSSTPTTTLPPSSIPGSSSSSPTSSDPSTSSTATPTPVGGSSSTNVGAIAGGTVAGVAVLVIVALLYIFFVCKPRQSRRRALARQASGMGLGSPRNGEFGYTGHGKYGGLTSVDSHTMLESSELGRNIHGAALGPSSAGVAAAATVGLRGLDPPPAAGRKSRDRPDREKRTLSSSSNSPYGPPNVNANATPTRRHHDSQAESLATTVVGFGAGDGKEDFDYDITNSNVLTDTDRSLSRSRSGSHAHGHNYSPSEEKYNDTNVNDLEFIPALNYDGAETRRRPSLSGSTKLNATSPAISSPPIPGAARKTARKPVPAYDASLTPDTTTGHVNATPTTPTMDNPFATPIPTGGHYAKRQAGPVQEDKSQNVWPADDPRHIALQSQQAHELQHKSSFGPGGMPGPMYELMPDILPSSGR